MVHPAHVTKQRLEAVTGQRDFRVASPQLRVPNESMFWCWTLLSKITIGLGVISHHQCKSGVSALCDEYSRKVIGLRSTIYRSEIAHTLEPSVSTRLSKLLRQNVATPAARGFADKGEHEPGHR